MNPDFCDMLSAFNAAHVEYLVVGAYAMATHGLVRATGDIDLWIHATPDNAERVMEALRAFRAPLFGLTVADLCQPDVVFQIGLPPRRINILTSIAGITFDEGWNDRRPKVVAQITFSVLSPEMLIKNKQATGRPKDAADVAWLKESLESLK